MGNNLIQRLKKMKYMTCLFVTFCQENLSKFIKLCKSEVPSILSHLVGSKM